jgi:hypothetical protein
LSGLSMWFVGQNKWGGWLSLVHTFACIIAPSTWWFCFESLPCSLASHASMIFLQNKALAVPHACLVHVVW